MIAGNQKMLELLGVKKRMADVERILAGIDTQMRLERTFSATSGNCHFISYSWGHIIIYSYPNESILTADIFTTKNFLFIQAIKKTLLEIFAPRQYLSFDQIRTVGNEKYA